MLGLGEEDLFCDLPGKGLRLTGQSFPGSSFLPFLKMDATFPFSSHLQLPATMHGRWIRGQCGSSSLCTNGLMQTERRSDRTQTRGKPGQLRSSLTGRDQPYKALRKAQHCFSGFALAAGLCDSLPAQLTLNVTAEECCQAKAFIIHEGCSGHSGDDHHVLSLLATFSDLALSP